MSESGQRSTRSLSVTTAGRCLRCRLNVRVNLFQMFLGNPASVACKSVDCATLMASVDGASGMPLRRNHMAKQSREAEPSVEWTEGEFRVSLPLQGGTVDAKWRPGATTVVRIREAGAETWSPGFETPLNGCSFVGLEPNTEYEIQVTHKNAAGEGPPARLRCRTEPNGDVGKIIPFPKK